MTVQVKSEDSAVKTEAKEGNRPVHEVRSGRIKASIWQNEAKEGKWYSVQISRLYKEGEDWKSTGSFHDDDLLLVAKVADLAHTWTTQQARG